MVIDHPSVTDVSQEDVYENGKWKRVVVVLTTLTVDASGPDYDRDQMEQLQNAVVKFMKSYSSLVETVIIRQKVVRS